MELVMTMHICTSIAEYYKDIAGYIDIVSITQTKWFLIWYEKISNRI